MSWTGEAPEGDGDALYEALRAKDVRFDGRVFVGVRTTGVFCRPVCRARTPKRENCSFYASAAEAERAGFRPCLVCRPELAPGRPIAGSPGDLARRAARMIEEGLGTDFSLEELASGLGCGGRRLRRAFAEEFRVPPVRYLQTSRLLMAKSLLTDTSLSVSEVAMAAGFGSLRRFNGLFRSSYGLSPTDLRRRGPQGGGADAGVRLTLGYRPPYRWDAMAGFLGRRAISGVEAVSGGEYLRTVRLAAPGGGIASGWIGVRDDPARNSLSVFVSEGLVAVVPQALARVKRLFDLYCEPDAVSATLSAMNDVRPGLYLPGTRLPGCFEPFEIAVRAVVGQQITVRAAGTLAARIAQEFGSPVRTGAPGLERAFPSPEDIFEPCGQGAGLAERRAESRLTALGVTAARAKAIVAIADAFAAGRIDLERSARPEEEAMKLAGIPGIGRWTAGYIAMRGTGWPDAFLETDAGVKRALPDLSPRELAELARTWRPWRSYATVSLWDSL
ncbi:MAG: helix-turn-helix domain-containing protein [Deltaproteobacteria bacterium]|jgi:AraC family transcriptional regulator of adaptative response / DNA-3-methyladenine glycosylase II|nr:helix-turn-helix domain-containing protein [Deltaproteobacteria bacterium]